jgi:hypothetical protein
MGRNTHRQLHYTEESNGVRLDIHRLHLLGLAPAGYLAAPDSGPKTGTVQAMWHKNGNQRQGGECVLGGHSGLEALGGGLFEDVVQTPLGKCSINTHL